MLPFAIFSMGGIASLYGMKIKVVGTRKPIAELQPQGPQIINDPGIMRQMVASMTRVGLGHYTSASGYDKVTGPEATKQLLTSYPPLGILDRSIRQSTDATKTFWGNLENDWYAYLIRVKYNDSQTYWDSMEMCTDPKTYVSFLSLWPTSNIGLSPFLPFGGMDFNTPLYGGAARPWNGAYEIPQSLNFYRAYYANAVMEYSHVVGSYCLDQAAKAANVSGLTDQTAMAQYFSTIAHEMNGLKHIHEQTERIYITDKISGKQAYSCAMRLPHRLFVESQAAVANGDTKEQMSAYDWMRPIIQGEVLPTPSEAAGVTIGVEVNGVRSNLTVEGAVAYFTGLSSYILLRQQEKVWNRFVQLSDKAVPLQLEDCILDPTRNPFLNVDWYRVADGMTRAYIEESKADAALPSEARTFIATAGPSASQMLRAKSTMAKELAKHPILFQSANNPIGVPQNDSGMLKILAIGAAAAAGIYAYKEGHI